MKKTLIALLALAGASLAADSFSITAGSAEQWQYNIYSDSAYVSLGTHAAAVITSQNFAEKQLYGSGNNRAEIDTVASNANSWPKRESANVGTSSFNIYGRTNCSGEWFMAANAISAETVAAAQNAGILSTSITFSIKTIDFKGVSYTIDLGIVEKVGSTCTLLGSADTQTLTSSSTTNQVVVSDPLSVNVSDFNAEEGATYYSVFRIIGPSGTGASYNTASFSNWTAAAGIAVPEPATATLSLLALAGLAARRRRK